MKDGVLDAVAQCVGAGADPVDAVLKAIRQHPEAHPKLSMMLGLAAKDPAALESLRDRRPYEPPPGLDDATESWRAVFAQLATQPPRWTEAAERLRPFVEGPDPWPLVVAHPLKRLVAALRHARVSNDPSWSVAYLALRDTSEGVARLLWVLLVADTLGLLQECRDLRELGTAERVGVEAVLQTMSRQFSFGTVAYLSEQGAWQTWRQPRAELANRPSVLVARALELWRKPLLRLRDWRNLDFGHGLVGDETRFAQLFQQGTKQKRTAFDDLVLLADGLRGCFVALQKELENWPSTAEASEENLSVLTFPVAWQGNKEALWLMEGADRRQLLLRGIVSGRRCGVELPEELRVWAQLAATLLSEGHPVVGGALCVDAGTMDSLDRYAEAEVMSHEIPMTPLLQCVDGALEQGGRVAVVGSAGCGKSRLCRQWAEAKQRSGGRTLVLKFSTRREERVTTAVVVSTLNTQLEQVAPRLRLVLPTTGEARLTVDPTTAKEFWRSLRKHNPGVPFVVVVDGLDEAGDLPGETAVADVMPPPDLSDTRVVLSWRNLEQVGQSQRSALANWQDTASSIDLDAFFQGNVGHELLRGYLKKRHPSTEPFAEQLIEVSQGRFLWVYHYARGMEFGMLRSEAVPTWPKPEGFYAAFFDHLESRVGRHPRYVGTLRELLFTLAEASAPLNDETLLTLLGLDPENSDSDGSAVRSWILPVLADLSDVLERQRADRATTDESLRAAWWHVRADVESGKRRANIVRRIAHVTLIDYLRGDALPEAWRGKREEVRQRLADATFKQIAAWAEDQELRDRDQLPAPMRYALHGGWRHASQAGRWEDLIAEITKRLPDPSRVLRHCGFLPAWREAWRAAVATAPLQLPDDATEAQLRVAIDNGHSDTLRKLAGARIKLGEVLMALHDYSGARFSHERALLAMRLLAGVAHDANEEQLQLAMDNGRSADLCGLAVVHAWLGRAQRALQDYPNARQTHERELLLKRVLTGVASDASEMHVRFAVAKGRRAGLRALALAHGNLGTVEGALGDYARAQHNHERALVLMRALAGIPDDASEKELQAAINRGHRRALRELAQAHGDLGQAQLALHNYPGARQNHERELLLKRVLAVNGRPAALRDLAIAHDHLGRVMLALGDYPDARLSYERELSLVRALAGVPDNPNDAQLRAALDDGRADALRHLAIAHSQLGHVQEALQDYAGARHSHKLELLLNRVLADVPEDATEEQLRVAIDNGRRDVLRELVIAHGNLGRVQLALGDHAGARLNYEREHLIKLVLAGVSDDASEAQLPLPR